jgi:hypothetical protein
LSIVDLISQLDAPSRVGCKGDFEKWVAEGEEWKRLWDASQGWVNGQGEPREWKI